MELKHLAMEYRRTADGLQQRIEALREELRTARGQEALLLQKRVELLYAELVDVRKIMGHLNNYYPSEKEEGKWFH